MATKAAKSITINATKYELANTVDYQGGKVQLKAKDVLLSEVEVGDSDFVITLAENQNFASNGSKTLAESFAASDLEAAIKAGKRIKVLVPKFENMNEAGYTDYAVITPDAYYDFSAAQFELVFGHYDNYNQIESVKMLVCAGFGTITSLNLTSAASKHTDFLIDLTDGQEMFDFTNTTWTCISFDAADLKAAIAAGKRIVIRSKNYLDNDNPTTNTMYLACSRATDSESGNQVMLCFFDGIKYYEVLTAYTGTVTSLNVYHESTSGN